MFLSYVRPIYEYLNAVNFLASDPLLYPRDLACPQVLRFAAQLDTPDNKEGDRNFIMIYHVADATIEIKELVCALTFILGLSEKKIGFDKLWENVKMYAVLV